MTDFINQNTNLRPTGHGQARMQQRGFSQTDIHVILDYGTSINDNEIFLRNKDADHEIRTRRDDIRMLKRQMSKDRVSRCGTDARQGNDSLSSQISDLRREISRFDRLRNRKIVIGGNRLVTCYPCSKSGLKRISRIIH